MYFNIDIKMLPSISYINRNITVANWSHFYRTSNEYILFIIEDGEMNISENGEEYSLHRGDVLLLEPGLTHVGTKPATCTYIYIHFSRSSIESIDDDKAVEYLENLPGLFYRYDPYSIEGYSHMRLIIQKKLNISNAYTIANISSIVDSICEEFTQANPFYKTESSLAAIKIAQILSTYCSRMVLGNNSEIKSSESKITMQVLSFLNAHYAENLSGNHISEALEYNYDYINRAFKRQMGTTVFKYLNKLRITKAKELLLSGNMMVCEIAEAVGFTDIYQFSRAFKTQVGVSPKNYFK